MIAASFGDLLQMKWRWDQGRLDYFQFDEIRRISLGLMSFNGSKLPKAGEPDTLRHALRAHTSLPFAPSTYTVWRNYKRVFGCQMLADEVGGVLVCTELCKRVAKGTVTADEYFWHVATNFSYPSPVFSEYESKGKSVFPMCALLKLLIVDFVEHDKPAISLDEVVARVKGYGLDGDESWAHYAGLKTTATSASGDESRQIRELMRFISQISFLKWKNPYLILDVASKETARELFRSLTPQKHIKLPDPAKELLNIGGVPALAAPLIVAAAPGIDPVDQEFIEGKKVRVTHLRSERSSKLRELFFGKTSDPHRCDMCEMATLKDYPWVNRLIELHHLLPLSSPIKVEASTTSLKDVVGVCPSCHRATHRYYSAWLKKNGADDFSDRSQAIYVYGLAKDAYAG
jgi:hypothetical protein